MKQGLVGVAMVLLATVGCNDDDVLTPEPGNVSVSVTGAGDGSGNVTDNEPSVAIDCDFPTILCSDTFIDVGGGGVFRLIATAAEDSVFAGWTNCPAPAIDECELSWGPNETSPSFSVTATFELVAGNACHEAYATAAGYLPCSGAGANECKFYTLLGDTTSCTAVCAGGGGTCLQSIIEEDDGCTEFESGSCDDVVGDRICVCTQP